MCLHAPAAHLLLCFLIKPDGIVRGMMDSYEPHNSQQMDHKKLYTWLLASRQVSVLAVCWLMKVDGIVRRRMDGASSLGASEWGVILSKELLTLLTVL